MLVIGNPAYAARRWALEFNAVGVKACWEVPAEERCCVTQGVRGEFCVFVRFVAISYPLLSITIIRAYRCDRWFTFLSIPHS